MGKMEQAKRLFFEALSAQEKGELIAAERRYEDALALAPNRPSLMNNLAVVYIQSANICKHEVCASGASPSTRAIGTRRFISASAVSS